MNRKFNLLLIKLTLNDFQVDYNFFCSEKSQLEKRIFGKNVHWKNNNFGNLAFVLLF